MADVELAEVRDFLGAHAPFSSLPPAVLAALVRDVEVRYHRRGTALMAVGAPHDELGVVRSGAIEIRDADGVLVTRGAEGTAFGSTTLVAGGPSRHDVTTIEDSLVLYLPARVFHQLSAAHPAVADFFDEQRADRMRGATEVLHAAPHGDAILRTHAVDLVRREPVSTTPGESAREAARTMTREGVSCLLVLDEGHLVGILTDRDLRRRVLAEGRDPAVPVREVMTPDPVVADADALAMELLLTMTERRIHHLPVVDGHRPLGVVTTTDLVRVDRASAVHLAGDVARAPDVTTVATLVGRLPTLVEQLVAQDASAHDITRVVTALGDAVSQRVLDLALDDLGPAPTPFCWMVLGSAARHERGLGSDQDHALVLDESVTPDEHDYYGRLAERVTDGLARCGYPRCDGDVMATRWRQPVSAWRRDYRTWVHEPVPDAVLRASIFFDSRPVHGDPGLHEQVAADVRAWTPQGERFLVHLAKQAVANEPPLGFFRGLVVAGEGEHRDTLDLKRGGVGAVVDLARVHALASGVAAVGTRARLAAAAHAGSLTERSAADLADAFEFLSYVRLEHQARQVRAGLAPDSRVSPEELTAFERHALRDAFRIVRSGQQALAQRFSTTYVS